MFLYFLFRSTLEEQEKKKKQESKDTISERDDVSMEGSV